VELFSILNLTKSSSQWPCLSRAFFVISSSRSNRFCYRLTRKPAATPTGLEIKASSDPIHIQQFTRQVQPSTAATFHRRQVHLAQINATSGHKLFPERAAALNG
jgi:hypothetical protein